MLNGEVLIVIPANWQLVVRYPAKQYQSDTNVIPN